MQKSWQNKNENQARKAGAVVTERLTQNLSAFPVYNQPTDGFSFQATSEGMTLRDYFAAKAMQGIVISIGALDKVDDLVGAAYEIADAMLEEREKH